MDLNSITVVITRQSGIKTVLVDLVGCALCNIAFYICVISKRKGGGAHGEGEGEGVTGKLSSPCQLAVMKLSGFSFLHRISFIEQN